MAEHIHYDVGLKPKGECSECDELRRSVPTGKCVTCYIRKEVLSNG